MNNKRTNLESFDRFDEVDSPELKAWNRLFLMVNVWGSHGKEVASQYFHQFNKEDKGNIGILMDKIKQSGLTSARQSVMKAAFE